YHLIRADGSSKRYPSMIQMLQHIDREDLENLWMLVKAKYGNTRLEEGYKRVLWGDLKGKHICGYEYKDSGRKVKETQAEVTEGSKTRAERSSKREGEELEFNKSKKQKLNEQAKAKADNDQRETKMKLYIKIIPNDEIAIDAIPLATKPGAKEKEFERLEIIENYPGKWHRVVRKRLRQWEKFPTVRLL
nr:hypothetical protein [Tanacetum cinerariifolium]